MAVLKFRVYPEDDTSVYRDIAIKHTQNFKQLHECILSAFGFSDTKHEATFCRSNETWQRGREISLEKYNKPYRAEPLLMAETPVGKEIQDTNQHFIYEYDFEKNWICYMELINVTKDENPKTAYPCVTRTEGLGPQQFNISPTLDEQYLNIEKKYNLAKSEEVFEEEADDEDNEEDGDETENNEDF
jgi:hypothetical protein